jgi:SAM-dependent methyltransferase
MALTFHPFLNPSTSPGNIDLFLHRSRILHELRSASAHLRGTLLDLGCGSAPYKPLLLYPPFAVTNYIGLDRPGRDSRADLTWDGDTIPLGDASVDAAICTEVLEHCPDPGRVLGEIHRVLKPEGFLFVTVPFLWPLHEVPYDWQRLTPFALDQLLRDAGFKMIKIQALGGWDSSLAQCLGLYLRRRPMPRALRLILTALFFPFYRLLLALGLGERVSFQEGQMITGLVAGAWASTNR